MRVLGIMFYMTVISLIGLALIVFSVLGADPQYLLNWASYLSSTPTLKFSVGLAGALLILISYWFAQMILGRFAREKTVAFSTSAGQVTISLAAIEDLIKRLTGIIPEIKELRPNVIAKKSGAIVVNLRAILKGEANIPELTARLQDLTRAKIQEVLGVEEEIIIRIHVSKIIPFDEREKKKRECEEKPEHDIPFGRLR